MRHRRERCCADRPRVSTSESSQGLVLKNPLGSDVKNCQQKRTSSCYRTKQHLKEWMFDLGDGESENVQYVKPRL